MPGWLLPILSAGAFLGAIVTAIMTWRSWDKQKVLASYQADLNGKIETSRQDAATRIEHLKAWLGEDMLRRLDADRAAAARELESLKAQLAFVGRVRGTLEEKRAAVASEALVAALRLLDALDRAAGTQVYADADTPKDERREQDFDRRWAETEPYQKEFYRLWVLAEAHLPDEVDAVLESTFDVLREMRANQRTHVDIGGHDPQFFRAGFGAVPKAAITEKRKHVKQVLRTYVEMAPVPSVGETPGPPHVLPDDSAPSV